MCSLERYVLFRVSIIEVLLYIEYIAHSEFEEVTSSLACQSHSLQPPSVVCQSQRQAELSLRGKGEGREGGTRGVGTLSGALLCLHLARRAVYS